MPLLSRKRSVLGAAAILVVLAAAANAHWTAGGDGSASARAGDTTPLTVNQSTVLEAMYPGDSAQTISGTFDNPNAVPIRVGTVTASISSVVKAGDAPAGTCDASDFTLAGAAMTVNAEVPTGDAQGAWTAATIKFNNKAANQDACKGATVNLSYAIS